MPSKIFFDNPIMIFRVILNYIKRIKIEVSFTPKKTVEAPKPHELIRKCHGYSDNFTCKCRWCNNENM